MVNIPYLILGVLMWEIFHDVQYDVLVWLFQRHRVAQNMHASPVEKILFTPGWERIVLYALLILGYGYIGVVTSFSDINLPEKILMGGGAAQWLLRISLASALLHFYYDGFIWRVRNRDIRQGLGLPGKGKRRNRCWSGVFALASHRRIGNGSFSWFRWLFGFAQYHGWNPDFESQVLNLSRAIPDSWLAHFLAGTYYKGKDQFGPSRN